MKRLTVIFSLVLSACVNTAAPVIPKWPAVPADLQQPPAELKPLDPGQRSLSDLIENSNENYMQYYILKERYEGWQNWYNTQENIWKGLK